MIFIILILFFIIDFIYCNCLYTLMFKTLWSELELRKKNTYAALVDPSSDHFIPCEDLKEDLAYIYILQESISRIRRFSLFKLIKYYRSIKKQEVLLKDLHNSINEDQI